MQQIHSTTKSMTPSVGQTLWPVTKKINVVVSDITPNHLRHLPSVLEEAKAKRNRKALLHSKISG